MFGSLRKLYRNTLFRLSLLGALLFVLSLFAALGYVYYAVVESELRRVDRAIDEEISQMKLAFDEAGKAGAEQAKAAGLLLTGCNRRKFKLQSNILSCRSILARRRHRFTVDFL